MSKNINQMMNEWKYLEDLLISTRNPKDREKIKRAKRALGKKIIEHEKKILCK